MLNFELGSPTTADQRSAILTREGASGHALFGPYEDVEPGQYEVSFQLHLATESLDGPDRMCALVDVASNTGSVVVASLHVLKSHLACSNIVTLAFDLPAPANLEFRVRVNGQTPLIIADEPKLSHRASIVAAPVEITAVDADASPIMRKVREECFLEGVQFGMEAGNVIIPKKDFAQVSAIASRFDTDGPRSLPALLAERFRSRPDHDLYDALYGGSSSLRGEAARVGLTSTLCQQLHFSLDEFRFWMRAMQREARLHRKDWEWFYIAQSLFDHGLLAPGKQGLVFAVGIEPLPALFASYGCQIVATDQSPEQAVQSGWMNSNQYSQQVDSLYDGRICDRNTFFSSVHYRSVDMNDIPEDLNGKFDFCWSSCAYEHLGSLERGIKFVENSLATLVPGGVAVHTTEFNISSNDETLESEHLSIFRRQDIEETVRRLESHGHAVSPIDWTLGNGFAECLVDLPPYKQSPHLRLRIAEYDCTSIGLIIQKRKE